MRRGIIKDLVIYKSLYYFINKFFIVYKIFKYINNTIIKYIEISYRIFFILSLNY